MYKTTVKRTVILEKVRANRETHLAEYNEAMNGWKAETIKVLENTQKEIIQQIEDIKAGVQEIYNVVSYYPRKPENHLDDYDQVIGMLEDSIDENVILTFEEYGKYVKDRWEWMQSFKMSTVNYVGKKKL